MTARLTWWPRVNLTEGTSNRPDFNSPLAPWVNISHHQDVVTGSLQGGGVGVNGTPTNITVLDSGSRGSVHISINSKNAVLNRVCRSWKVFVGFAWGGVSPCWTMTFVNFTLKHLLILIANAIPPVDVWRPVFAYLFKVNKMLQKNWKFLSCLPALMWLLHLVIPPDFIIDAFIIHIFRLTRLAFGGRFLQSYPTNISVSIGHHDNFTSFPYYHYLTLTFGLEQED